MIKKNNGNNWLLLIVLAIALVAIIVSAIALHKANITGQGIFDFLKKSETKQIQNIETEQSRGMLAEAYLASGKSVDDLKGYEVKYDYEGNLIYEINSLENGRGLSVGTQYSTQLSVGENYQFVQDPENPNQGQVMSPGGVGLSYGNIVFVCGCTPGADNCMSGGCYATSYSSGEWYCNGHCTSGSQGCVANFCRWGVGAVFI